MTALSYLKSKEWSMGNGQCPECCGVHEGWFGHPCYMTPDTIGHRVDCSLALSLIDVGDTPLMRGEFKSDIQFESYISDTGFFGTRHKTEHGCPKMKAFNKKLEQSMRTRIESLIKQKES